MIIIEILIEAILRMVTLISFSIGGYTLVGALYFWSSAFATEEDTFIKCIKKSWRYTKEMKSWYES